MGYNCLDRCEGQIPMCPHHIPFGSHVQLAEKTGKKNARFDPPHCRLRGHIDTGRLEQTFHFSPEGMRPLQSAGSEEDCKGLRQVLQPRETSLRPSKAGGRAAGSIGPRQKTQVLLGSIPVAPYYTTCSLPSTELYKAQGPSKAKKVIFRPL